MTDKAKLKLALDAFQKIDFELKKLGNYAHETVQMKSLCSFMIKTIKDEYK